MRTSRQGRPVNRRTPGHNTHVTDHVGGIRHISNTGDTRGSHTKRSDTFTDERRAPEVLWGGYRTRNMQNCTCRSERQVKRAEIARGVIWTALSRSATRHIFFCLPAAGVSIIAASRAMRKAETCRNSYVSGVVNRRGSVFFACGALVITSIWGAGSNSRTRLVITSNYQ